MQFESFCPLSWGFCLIKYVIVESMFKLSSIFCFSFSFFSSERRGLPPKGIMVVTCHFSVPTPHGRNQKNIFPETLGPGCRNVTWACDRMCLRDSESEEVGGLLEGEQPSGGALCLRHPGPASWGLCPVGCATVFIGPDAQGGLRHCSCY